MEQVMVRRAQLHGKLTVLELADVITASGDGYRVKVRGHAVPIEVKKTDTVAVPALHGGQARVTSRTLLPTKSFGAPHSLAGNF